MNSEYDSTEDDRNSPIAGSSDKSPFAGALSIESGTTASLYWRDAVVTALLAKLRVSDFLAVVGPTGSGKRAAVYLGLLHSLQLGQEIAGSDKWRICKTKPGADPLAELAETVAGKTEAADDLAQKMAHDDHALAACLDSSAAKPLIIVDMLEQIFVLCDDRCARTAYIGNLLSAAATSAA